jgi:hypothetical protein
MKTFKELLSEANKVNKNLQRLAMANFTSPLASPAKPFDPQTEEDINNLDPLTAARVKSQAKQTWSRNFDIKSRQSKIIDLVGQQLEKNPDLAFNLQRYAATKKAAYGREAKQYGYYGGNPKKPITPQITHELMGVMGRTVQSRMGGRALPHHGSYTY